MKKKLPILIILLIIGVAAGVYYWRSKSATTVLNGNDLVLYGNVDIREVRVAFNGSEHVSEMLVDEGEQVKAGQLLARLQTERFVDPAPFRTKLEGEGEVRFIAAVNELRADLIVLAGFMRVLKPGFLTEFDGKIINLHPSLLPQFPGLDAIGQALNAGVKETGCTVHRVTLEVDGGPILAQSRVPIEPGDTHDSLATRVHAAEHALLPAVIAKLSLG